MSPFWKGNLYLDAGEVKILVSYLSSSAYHSNITVPGGENQFATLVSYTFGHLCEARPTFRSSRD